MLAIRDLLKISRDMDIYPKIIIAARNWSIDKNALWIAYWIILDDMNGGVVVNMEVNWREVLFNQLQDVQLVFRSWLHVSGACLIYPGFFYVI